MKYKSLFFFWCSVLMSIQITAQPIVGPQTLHFHSTLETEVLSLPTLEPPTKLEAKIRLLLAPDPTANEATVAGALSGVNQLIIKLEGTGILKKKPEKAAKILFNSIHEDLLVKYDENAIFNQIFTTGTYNCVTASALYTLVLDHFGMLYSIRELPTHVYLILNPGQEQLILESTDPSLGIFQINKEKAVRMLAEQKIISEAEYRKKSVDELYEEYLETEEKDINLRQLVGDLYYNQALAAYEEEEYLTAEQMAEKGAFLYPADDFIQWIWMQSLIAQLDALAPHQPMNYRPLFRLQYFPDLREAAQQDIIQGFGQASEALLIAKNLPDDYFQLHDYFRKNLAETAIMAQTDIAFIHHFQLGRHYLLTNNPEQAQVQLDSAHTLQPAHLAVQQMLREIVYRQFNDWIQTEDINKLETKTRLYQERYTFLREETRFKELYLFSQVARPIMAFEDNQEEEGLAAFAEIEPLLEKLNDGSEQADQVMGSLFGTISSYYVRITNYKEALRWLEAGLKLVPESKELLRKKVLLEE